MKCFFFSFHLLRKANLKREKEEKKEAEWVLSSSLIDV
jgi:hypothetical protein